MRTTLDLSDAIMRRAKKKAAEEGKTLTKVIEEALRHHLEPRKVSAKRFRFKMVTHRGRLRAGVDIADRNSLYDLMEERK